jgi:hypothetical protein
MGGIEEGGTGGPPKPAVEEEFAFDDAVVVDVSPEMGDKVVPENVGPSSRHSQDKKMEE